MAHPEVVPTGPFPTPGFPSTTETPYPQSIHRPTEHPRVCVWGGQAMSRWGSHGESPNSRQFPETL